MRAENQSLSFPRWMMVVSALAALILVGGGFWFYRVEERHLRQAVEKELQTIVSLKADQIAQWRTERLANAALLMESPFMMEGVGRWLSRSHAEPAEQIMDRFRSLQKHYHFDEILLVDATGDVRLSLTGHRGRIHELAARALAESFRDRKPMITDLHAGPDDPSPHIDAIAPFFGEGGKASQPAGALILRTDARKFLYPLIKSWPTLSKSAETLLVRREGDAALFLNDLRHRQDTALKLRIPLSQKNVPAVMAVLGKEGIIQGKDYRGVEVLSVLKAIPDSPWFMIGKQDAAEALSVWYFTSRLILGIMLALLISGGAVLGALWQQKKKAHYRALFQAEETRRLGEERYRITMMSIGDGVITTDAEGRVDLMNAVAEELTGWSQEVAQGKPLDEVFRIINEETRNTVENPANRVIREGITVGLANHTTLIARDGAERPIADSGAPIRDEKGKLLGVVLVFRDQTADRAAEKALRESEEKYRNLFQNMRQGVFYQRADGVLLDANPAAQEMVGLTRDEFLKRTSEDQAWDVIREDGSPLPGEEHPSMVALKTGKPVRDAVAGVFHSQRKGYTWLVINAIPEFHPGETVPHGVFVTWHDITERKQAENAARESEKRYRRLFDEAIEGIALADAETGEILDCNRAFSQLSGYDRSELIGKPQTLLHPREEGASPFSSTFEQHRGEGQGSLLPTKFVTKSGAVKNVEIKASVLEIGGRKVMQGFFRDVTAEQQYHHERETTLKLLRFLNYDNDTQEMIRSLTAFLQEWSGCEAVGVRLRSGDDFPYFETRGFPAEFVQMKSSLCARDVCGEPVRDSQGNPILECMCGNILCGRFNPALPFFTPKGSFWTNSTTALLTGTTEEDRQGRTRNRCNGAGYESVALIPLRYGGQTAGLLQFNDRAKDRFTPELITFLENAGDQIAMALTQRQSKAALRESEERYRNLVENAPLGVLTIDSKGTIIDVNSRLVSLLGSPSAEETRAINILTFPPLVESGIAGNYRLCLETGAGGIYENTYRSKWGKEVCLRQYLTPVLEAEGKAHGVLAIMEDISEQKKLESQLIQAQKMEAIGTLAGGIAHDFNNILGAIMGYAELAGFDIGENAKAKYNLQQSLIAAQRAKGLVQQILTFSRRGVQERKILDIKPIIKEGLKFLRSSLPATIEIRQDVEEDLGTIEADPTQIYQVLMNLCTNAAHAMEAKGGVLEVSLGNMQVDGGTSGAPAEMDPGPYVRLRVSDTGHGMPAEVRERIFDPYFTTKEVGKGTGLGLAVVHGIVTSCGGGIAVSSEVEKGSVFDVYFPRLEAVKMPPEASRVESLPLGGNERVLFVDDERAIAEIGKEVLERLGYEAEVRTSSVEAFELFRADPHRFDLVITDMTMPNMTGDKLAQELIRIRPGIPIILCTGFSEHITEEKAKALGIREFVMKPLIITELANAMRRALGARESKKRRER